MQKYKLIPKSRFFDVCESLDRENQSDHKVTMIGEVNMTGAQQLRQKQELETGVRPSYTALVAKAVALALRSHPHANRVCVGAFFWRSIVQLKDVDVSVAVEFDEAGEEQKVFVGTIRNTDRLNLASITKELQGMVTATPENCPRLRLYEWIVRRFPLRLAVLIIGMPRWFIRLWIEHRGGAAIISSPAKYGVDIMAGAWPYPLGFSFGLVKERPFAIEGRVAVVPTMQFTMSFDRRMIAGAPAARLFAAICNFLEKANSCLDDEGERS